MMRFSSILYKEAGGDRCGDAEESVDALSHGGLLALAAGEDAVQIKEIPAVLSIETEGDLSLLNLLVVIFLEKEVYVVAGKLDGLRGYVGSCDRDRHVFDPPYVVRLVVCSFLLLGISVRMSLRRARLTCFIVTRVKSFFCECFLRTL